MNYQLSELFRRKYKKQNMRIKKAIDKTLITFFENPSDSSLHNHALQREWIGYRSINIPDVKNDCRAIYKEIEEANTTFAYFYLFGTHKELYDKWLEIKQTVEE